jgi:phosphoserine aminotransferase
MTMISFYPGPSRIHDEIPVYTRDAARDGIMSINHRSAEFMTIVKRSSRLLKQKLGIPNNYTILYASSATECWEIIAQSLVATKSHHLYNGAFGQKWFDYAHRIKPSETEAIVFSREEKIDVQSLALSPKESLICITQNETSNGTQVSQPLLKELRAAYKDALIAVDATSSMAGIKLDFKQADVWFASVQKCFGLPAGLAVLACSPQAIERALSLNEKKHYNSLTSMISMMEKWQTTHTPNVLGIYLLMRVLEKVDRIETVHATTVNRFRQWKEFLKSQPSFRMLIANEDVQSFTVLPLEADTATVTSLKRKAKNAGFLLGEGYGDLKATTFRIANFPALRQKEISALQQFIISMKKS